MKVLTVIILALALCVGAADAKRAKVAKYVLQVTPSLPAAQPEACADWYDADGQNLAAGWFWRHGVFGDAKVYRYRVKQSTIPASLDVASTVDALRSGPRAWETTVNDCGFPAHAPLPGSWYLDTSYSSSQTGQSNISSTATQITCGPSRDGINMFKFLNLPNGIGAVTCTWRNASTGVAVESDQAYNTDYTWDVTDDGVCSGQPDLRAVAVHESGHTVGLGHAVPESEHPNLTMSPFIGFCETGPRTLGAGDYHYTAGIYASD